jgi:ssDNA-binding Zn-finger/Zn-ribbon topoisomerase 1
MGRFGQAELCTNLNHRRKDAPVGHCPQCGSVVNDRLPTQQCSESHHAAARRDRGTFCVDCGTQLIFDR